MELTTILIGITILMIGLFGIVLISDTQSHEHVILKMHESRWAKYGGMPHRRRHPHREL